MRQKRYSVTFSIIGFWLFLIPISISVGFGILIYTQLSKTGCQDWVFVISLAVYILFITLVFCLLDMFRRKIMIDEPVKKILLATQRIAMGDFDIDILPAHIYNNYDEYDIIIDNLNKMAKELAKSEILKSEFVSNVSHELKTPLSIIQNYAKALQTEKLDEDTKQKYLQTLINTSQKLSTLITNILKLNKLENQVINPKRTNVDLGELLSESILQFEQIIEDKHIDLKCQIDNINYYCESTYFEIIFNNLISNAIKFTDLNGKVSISLTTNDNNIIFIVKDSGCGMSEEVGKHIFEKFYQGETSHTGEGNGLGLALVKRVIDILGGEISVSSEIDKGSTFVVKIKRDVNGTI